MLVPGPGPGPGPGGASRKLDTDARTDRLWRSGIRISMDCTGRYLDTIFIERLWRTLNSRTAQRNTTASICMPVKTGSQARAGVRIWMEFYNHCRPHKALGGRPPTVTYLLTVEATQHNQQRQISA